MNETKVKVGFALEANFVKKEDVDKVSQNILSEGNLLIATMDIKEFIDTDSDEMVIIAARFVYNTDESSEVFNEQEVGE